MFTAMSVLADSGNWGHMGGWGGGWMWLWSLPMMGLFVAFFVWLVRLTVGTTASGPGLRGPDEHARGILAERYARGDLTTDEYRERVDALR